MKNVKNIYRTPEVEFVAIEADKDILEGSVEQESRYDPDYGTLHWR